MKNIIRTHKVDAVQYKGVRLALGTFVICRTENLLCGAGSAKLDEIRKWNSTKSVIQILTNTDHSISRVRRNPQPLFIRTAQYLGETQIDIRRIVMSPRYNRPPRKLVSEEQFDVRLSAFDDLNGVVVRNADC
jgi:hypothetical protein